LKYHVDVDTMLRFWIRSICVYHVSDSLIKYV